ncbi:MULTISPECIES: DEAD/DEAH box helicase [Trichocoleus]|uniref:DNA 3'-5' helicase n=1 Tax=Trichocoleus desertorum GB2-A4 TaxID=2933944 RepID=A0ABV0JCZ1_9CYAN|nr:nuclease-related domain-containing DEAD/DEAH box helicase [Trichocoleus sp. FACHB-46]MBD1864298.1 NERD domain-containing protein [Trichocoleus sp. FACHB-46]
MATLIPSLNSCLPRMTNGEKRLAERLERKLEEDYILWYDVAVGIKQLHPDFIVLHPNRGLFILEVKDWKLENIQRVTQTTVKLVTPNGIKEVKNPLAQARDYALAINETLERDRLLVQPEGRYQGKSALPYGYGVVFTEITRKAFEQTDLREVFEPHLVICRDEMTEKVDPEEFQKRLWDLCPYQFGKTLTAEQIDRVRWHLFPDLRISAKQLSLFEDEVAGDEPQHQELIPDLIKIMDLQQEQLARSLGEGHRVIHGVAGSGKTLILAYRCQHLAQHTTKPILVLCFNVSLAARLRQMIQEKGLSDRVKVRHFHGWCVDQLKNHQLPLPNWRESQGDAYVEQLVQRVIQGVDQGNIPAGHYGAVMIDEGHDFKPEWLKLVVQMVDPETNSLLLLYDDAQNLYGEDKQQKFSFKSVGIQAQGRTTILKLNYRNTAEVLTLAYEFAKEVMSPTDDQEDAPVLVSPQSVGRHGPVPELIRLPNFKHEADYLVERVQQFYERGTAWNEMAIVYRSKFMGECIYQQLQQAQVPIEWVNATNESRNFHPSDQSIKLMTMHSSKGLEFSVVFIPGVGYLPNQYGTIQEETRLFYVAMTRAIDQLVLTCDRTSEFVDRIQVALSRTSR